MTTIGTLFSGIGVPDLAARLLGMQTVFQVEKDAYCRRVLRKNFPDAALYGDIFEVSGPPYVDIIVAGFPCQPFSMAGRRLGEADERYLVPEMLRVIREVNPRVVLFENVPGFASIADGDTFKQFLRALAEMGFDAEWGHLSASDFGAPHQRERWWCVAYADQSERQTRRSDGMGSGEPPATSSCAGLMANAEVSGYSGQQGQRGDRRQPPLAQRTGLQPRSGNRRQLAYAANPRLSQSRQSNGHPGASQAAGGLDAEPQRRGKLVNTDNQRRDGDARRRHDAEPANGYARHGRAAQSGVCRDAHGTTAGMDRSRRGMTNVSAHQANASKTLRLLRAATGTEALQRDTGITQHLQPSPVLRPSMRRHGTAQSRRLTIGVQKAGQKISERPLRDVRFKRHAGLSPHRRGCDEQRTIECADVVRRMSYPTSLADWQVDPQAALRVRDLWVATRQVAPGDVRETLPALEKVWRSLPDKSKAWIAIRAGYSAGLNDWPWPSRPGENLAPWEPPRVTSGGVPNRAARLKTLGNTMVLPVVYAILDNIQSWLAREAVTP